MIIISKEISTVASSSSSIGHGVPSYFNQYENERKEKKEEYHL